MRPGPLNIFSATLQAYVEVAYQEALKEAKVTDRAAGDTVASDAVRASETTDLRSGVVFTMKIFTSLFCRLELADRQVFSYPDWQEIAAILIGTCVSHLQRTLRLGLSDPISHSCISRPDPTAISSKIQSTDFCSIR